MSSSELIPDQLAGMWFFDNKRHIFEVSETDRLLDCIRKPSLHVISFFSDLVSRHFIRRSRYGLAAVYQFRDIISSQDPFT